MAVTKANIVYEIQRYFGFSRKKCADLVETLLEIIKNRLENGEDVMISGFGKYCVSEKGGRKGRNPATGDDLMLPKRRVVTFKCSQGLRKRINGA